MKMRNLPRPHSLIPFAASMLLGLTISLQNPGLHSDRRPLKSREAKSSHYRQRSSRSKPSADMAEVRSSRTRRTDGIASLEGEALFAGLNFEVVAHECFKGPWPAVCTDNGLGASFSTPRVYDGSFMVAGITARTSFGERSSRMCMTRTCRSELHPLPPERVVLYPRQPDKKILIRSDDTSAGGPVPAVGPARADATFFDVRIRATRKWVTSHPARCYPASKPTTATPTSVRRRRTRGWTSGRTTGS